MNTFNLQSAITVRDRSVLGVKPLTQEQSDTMFSGPDSQLNLESATFEEIQETLFDGVPYFDEPDQLLSAITTKSNRLSRTMAAFCRELDKGLGGKITSGEEYYSLIGEKLKGKVVSSAIVSKPRKVGAYAVVTALIPLSDGQSVSVLFYAPDDDPLKINDTDTLIAFRFLLNKRDITHIVAPIKGKDLSLKQTVGNIAELALKNTDKFTANRAKQAEQNESLTTIQDETERLLEAAAAMADEVEVLKGQKSTVAKDIASTKAKLDKLNEANESLKAEVKADEPSTGDSVEVAIKDIAKKIGHVDAEKWLHRGAMSLADMKELYRRYSECDELSALRAAITYGYTPGDVFGMGNITLYRTLARYTTEVVKPDDLLKITKYDAKAVHDKLLARGNNAMAYAVVVARFGNAKDKKFAATFPGRKLSHASYPNALAKLKSLAKQYLANADVEYVSIQDKLATEHLEKIRGWSSSIEYVYPRNPTRFEKITISKDVYPGFDANRNPAVVGGYHLKAYVLDESFSIFAVARDGRWLYGVYNNPQLARLIGEFETLGELERLCVNSFGLKKVNSQELLEQAQKGLLPADKQQIYDKAMGAIDRSAGGPKDIDMTPQPTSKGLPELEEDPNKPTGDSSLDNAEKASVKPALARIKGRVIKDGNRDIINSLNTIRDIDNGTVVGMTRALFVSSVTGKIKTLAKNGAQDKVNNVLTMIAEYNAIAAKPLISLRNGIWKLGEVLDVVSEDESVLKDADSHIADTEEVFGGKANHWYGLRVRPYDISAQPSGVITYLDPQKASVKFPELTEREIRFGAVAYEQPLNQKDIDGYNLTDIANSGKPLGDAVEGFDQVEEWIESYLKAKYGAVSIPSSDVPELVESFEDVKSYLEKGQPIISVLLMTPIKQQVLDARNADMNAFEKIERDVNAADFDSIMSILGSLVEVDDKPQEPTNGSQSLSSSDETQEVEQSEESKQIGSLDGSSFEFGSEWQKEKQRDTKVIAKQISKHISQLKKSNALPKGVKVSVRSDYNSITMNVTGLPSSTPLFSDAYLAHTELDDGANFNAMDKHSSEVKTLLEYIKRFAGQFNYDNSDIDQDVSDKNFYSTVKVDLDLANERIPIELANYKQRKKALTPDAAEKPPVQPPAQEQEIVPKVNEELEKHLAEAKSIAQGNIPDLKVAMDTLQSAIEYLQANDLMVEHEAEIQTASDELTKALLSEASKVISD